MHPIHLCLLGDATSPHIQRWAHEMRARGYRVSLVTARPAAIDGVEQHVLRPVQRSAQWLLRAGEAKRAVQALAPDIVHAHYTTSYGYLGARCGRHPLVMTAWGSDLLVTPYRSPWMRWLTGWTLRQADLITGDSQSLVEAALGYTPRAAVHCIHWGVDLQRFAPADWDAKPGFEVVSLRAWEPNYNIPTIIDAFAQLRAGLANPAEPVHLHLLGGGSMETALRGQVAQLGIENAVTFHGRLDDAGMARVLARCKASVSVPDQDATSVSVLESMACGLPVVTTQLQANAQWLPARWLVPAKDSHALAQALALLAQDDTLARQAGQHNAQRMQHEGDRARQMDRMDALYRGLLPPSHPKNEVKNASIA
ncbi:glycosyltransferase [Acidovorax sp. RAC01]|uniref:glycosyltransferase n=1 Tax=Acidovorax sp. RAC01 TaxID=1842533 RepID=UPI00083E7263|nr:glycosyltransferase [Acidovorax sp. RAC01]AOG22886.1 glycosyl transferases group 1 family protein [Acidovorax sp. RAC01]